jgi:hypothetical protein
MVTVAVSSLVGPTCWYCRWRVDVTQGAVERRQMQAHSDDLQRGTEVDRYTVDAVFHQNGRLASGVVMSVGRIAAET